MTVVWSKCALRDLDEIAAYIANDSIKSAQLVEERIRHEVELLSQFPLTGRVGRVAGTRERVVARTGFILLYRIGSTQIRVLRILRGTRKWPRTFTL